MGLNEEKCHFMCLGIKTENETFLFKDSIMNSITNVILNV